MTRPGSSQADAEAFNGTHRIDWEILPKKIINKLKIIIIITIIITIIIII